MSKAVSDYLSMVVVVIFISSAFLSIKADPATSVAVGEHSLAYQKNPSHETITPIEKNKLYSDFLLFNESKVYAIEVLEENHILIFSFAIDTENATLEVNLEGPVARMRLSIAYDPMPYIYYVGSRGEVRILIKNSQRDSVRYRFFVDVSEPLGDNNSRILLLEGSRVAFYADLRRDDMISLNLTSSNSLNPIIRIFALCYEVDAWGGSYMLCLHRESLDKTLHFTADSGGRWYILVESIRGEGIVSLKSVITSPPWNQEWFWLIFSIAFITVISPFFVTRIKRIRSSESATLYALIGYYCWFITIGLSASSIGSFNFGATIFIPLFYLSIFFYGLSLGIQIYATSLDRKKTIGICRYCNGKVDLRENNYCCGKKVKNISLAWFLMPLSFGFLFFTISYVFVDQIFPQYIGTSLWIGSCGNIIGGTVAWWINRIIDKRSWIFLAIGILLFSFSPLIMGLLTELIFTPYIELEQPGRFTRMRIAPLTVPLGVIIIFATASIGLGLVIVTQIQKKAFNEKPISENLK